MLSLKIAINILLPICSCCVAWSVASSNPKHRRIGYWIGLFNQPMWVYIAIESQNYGIAFPALLYTYAWIKGIVGHTERFARYRKYFR